VAGSSSLSGGGNGMNKLASNAKRGIELLPCYQADNAIFLSVRSVIARQCLDRCRIAYLGGYLE
jgi:hypothetical protein